MIFRHVEIASISYELPSRVLKTEDVERQLEPIYAALGLKGPQIVALTGVRERRIWPKGTAMSDGAATAAQHAMAETGLSPERLGMVMFCGVCRDNLEPAGACAVAEAVGCSGSAQVLDVSNACLGVLNGMLLAAQAIEAGNIEAALITSCESSEHIIQETLNRLAAAPTMELYKKSLATFTGGSGAVAVLLVRRGAVTGTFPRLVAGVARTAPQHHRLCRWGPESGLLGETPNIMLTDAALVLQNGVALGVDTWKALMSETGWNGTPVKTICHQVGSIHRQTILQSIGVPLQRDYVTFEYLGNMGTVSLPATAAIAAERGFLESGDRVAFCGIGSGLNCISIGIEWNA